MEDTKTIIKGSVIIMGSLFFEDEKNYAERKEKAGRLLNLNIQPTFAAIA